MNNIFSTLWPNADNQTKKNRIIPFSLAIVFGIVIGVTLRDAPFLGSDWKSVYTTDLINFFYPPWTAIITLPLSRLPWRLGLAILNGLSVSTLAVTTVYFGKNGVYRYFGAILAIVSLPVFLLFWVGHIDALALLGLLAMPWGIPLLFSKGTFVIFAVFSNKNWFLYSVFFLFISMIIWPFWLNNANVSLGFRSTEIGTSVGWHVYGFVPLIVGIAMFLLSSRVSAFEMMSAGALIHPFLLPYHLVVLLPVLGMLNGKQQILLWIISWVSASAVGFGQEFYWLYYLFPITTWLMLRLDSKDSQNWLALVLPKMFRK